MNPYQDGGHEHWDAYQDGLADARDRAIEMEERETGVPVAGCAMCGARIFTGPDLNLTCAVCAAPTVLVLGNRHFRDKDGNILTWGEAKEEFQKGRRVYLYRRSLSLDDDGNKIIVDAEREPEC